MQKKKKHHSKPHVDGGVLKQVDAKYRKAAEHAAASQGQILLWLAASSIADVFNAGPERIQRTIRKMDEYRAELNEMIAENGKTYAYEKLREKAEKVSGIKIEYWTKLDAHSVLKDEQRNEDKGRKQSC